uniref:Uncharacterized protein n=1 Tax=Glossina austeni TaxID=7395 RepID=A0A1A9UYP5_GLOAU
MLSMQIEAKASTFKIDTYKLHACSPFNKRLNAELLCCKHNIQVGLSMKFNILVNSFIVRQEVMLKYKIKAMPVFHASHQHKVFISAIVRDSDDAVTYNNFSIAILCTHSLVYSTICLMSSGILLNNCKFNFGQTSAVGVLLPLYLITVYKVKAALMCGFLTLKLLLQLLKMLLK